MRLRRFITEGASTNCTIHYRLLPVLGATILLAASTPLLASGNAAGNIIGCVPWETEQEGRSAGRFFVLLPTPNFF
jgi:hypothetical protein